MRPSRSTQYVHASQKPTVSALGNSFREASTEREHAGAELAGNIPSTIPGWAAARAAPKLRANTPVRGGIDPADPDGGRVYEDRAGIANPERTPAKRQCSTVRAKGLQPLLTVAEAATILNVSVRTVLRLITSGSLRAVWIGRSVRLRPRDVQQLIAEG